MNNNSIEIILYCAYICMAKKQLFMPITIFKTMEQYIMPNNTKNVYFYVCLINILENVHSLELQRNISVKTLPTQITYHLQLAAYIVVQGLQILFSTFFFINVP